MDVPHKLILDYALEHGETKAERIYLTQPVGGDRVVDYTWGQVIDQSRRMAAHLRSRGFEPGARIAMLTKNCAHFVMAELATWMAGYTTVAIFPTETADTVRFVLEHSEASLLFVGKLDDWPQRRADDLAMILYTSGVDRNAEGRDDEFRRHHPRGGSPRPVAIRRQPQDQEARDEP